MIKFLKTSQYQLPVKADTETIVISRDDILKEQAAVGWELWLPFAARELHISADPKDYLIHPVPIMYSDLPNRNGYAFPLSELLKWNVEMGCQAYKSWAGMPMYEEHQSKDPTKALGVVIDVALRPILNFGRGKIWKVLALAAVDRTKNPKIADAMERNELNTYSMGCLVDACSCSYCGAIAGDCSHVPAEDTVTFYDHKGTLVFKNVHGIKAQELSVVFDPAFGTAAHTTRVTYDQGNIPSGTALLKKDTPPPEAKDLAAPDNFSLGYDGDKEEVKAEDAPYWSY